jgi:hypothetical protein
MSADAAREQRWSAADTIAGLLLMVSIFASTLGLVWRPARLVPFAVILALVAARMSARHERLATLAVAVAVVCWTVGMAFAVLTENPLY